MGEAIPTLRNSCRLFRPSFIEPEPLGKNSRAKRCLSQARQGLKTAIN
jgi:hypothetical protein